MRKDFNRMNLEQLCATKDFAWDFTSTRPDSTTYIDDFFSEVNLNEAKGNVDDNLYKILLIEKIMIEKLNNHDMNKVVEDEAPMQMFNLGVVRTTTKVVRRMVHRG